MATIALDPGHGGHDPGAIGSKSKEKDNVLKVALELKSLLESYGHKVILTRSTDKYLSLSERARIANNLGADYFISLHNNAAVNKSASGFETFIFNGKVDQKTIEFQKAVHDAIASKIGIRDRGKKRANFAVLRETKMPALLIEYAFITNTEDEKILINKVKSLAQWTCDGVIKIAGGKKKTSELSKPKTDADVYVVQKGDTLWGISRKFGMTVDKLKKSNGLTSDLIYPGQKLKVMKKEDKQKTSGNDIKVGQKVRIKNSATKYATGQSIPDWVKNRTYTVQQVKADRVLLKEIVSWVRKVDIEGYSGGSTAQPKPNLKVGSKVKIKKSAQKYATGQNIPSWVKGRTYTIQQVKSDRILLKEIMSWVYKKDVE